MHVSLAHRRYAWLLLLALLIAPFFLNLGASSLWDANEAFYAETPREMIESGDFINPSFNYKPRFNKPPLCYWVVAASYKLFGVSETAERLPLALGALVMLVTAFVLGRLAQSTEAGLLAVVALATVPRFLMFSRRIMIDVYIAMFMGLTLMFFALAEKYPEKRRLYLPLMYIAVGLGVMTKGPVAAALPGLAFLLYLLAERRLRSARDMMLIAGTLIVAAIVLPWYLAIYSEHGWLYIRDFLLRDNLSRYTQPVWGPRRGYFFYLPVMLGDLFPWSLFLFAAIGAATLPLFRNLLGALRRRRRAPETAAASATTSPPNSPTLNSPTKLLLIWIGVIVVFYSLSSNKEDLYISPIYTAAAALVGVWLAPAIFRTVANNVTAGPSLKWVTALSGLSILLVGGLVFYGFRGSQTGYALRGATAISVVAGVGGLSIMALALRRRFPAAVLAVALIFGTLNWLFVLLTLPDFERFKPVPALCQVIEREASTEALVGYYKIASPSMVYYLKRQIFEYYNPEELIAAFASGREVYCVLSRDEYETIRGSLPTTTRILASRPLFQVKLRGILWKREDDKGRKELPQVVLISNK